MEIKRGKISVTLNSLDIRDILYQVWCSDKDVFLDALNSEYNLDDLNLEFADITKLNECILLEVEANVS